MGRIPITFPAPGEAQHCPAPLPGINIGWTLAPALTPPRSWPSASPRSTNSPDFPAAMKEGGRRILQACGGYSLGECQNPLKPGEGWVVSEAGGGLSRERGAPAAGRGRAFSRGQRGPAVPDRPALSPLRGPAASAGVQMIREGPGARYIGGAMEAFPPTPITSSCPRGLPAMPLW